MTRLELTEVSDEHLGPLTLALEPGLSVVVVDSPQALARLSELLAGMRRPLRGELRLDRHSVHGSPQARARLLSLLPEERLLPAPSVAKALEAAAALRGLSIVGSRALERLGLQRFSELAPERLEASELRAVAFALVIACADHAAAVILHDPLALAPLVAARAVKDHVQALAERSVLVLLSNEFEDAVSFAGRVFLVEGGRLSPYVARAAQAGAVLRVRSPRAAELARSVSGVEGVEAVDCDPESSELTLRGPSLQVLSSTLFALAERHALPLLSLSGLVVPLPAPAWPRVAAAALRVAPSSAPRPLP
jgi:ABC-type thiamine transport system ATPase subunit